MFRRMSEQGIPLKPFLESLDAPSPGARFRHRDLHVEHADSVPHAFLHNLKHNKVLHERTVFLTIVPTTCRGCRRGPHPARAPVWGLLQDRGVARLHEQPDIDEILGACRVRQGSISTSWTRRSSCRARPSIPTADTPGHGLLARPPVRLALAQRHPRHDFFNIPANRVVELGTHIEI
jgi:KUP system potassium uptake protein